MTERWQATTPADPLVLHVIPNPVGRGAQREARALADQLDSPGERAHRVLALFDGPNEVRPDLSLRFDPGRAAGTGYRPRLVPLLRSVLGQLEPAVVVAHGGDPLKYLVPSMAGLHPPLVYYAIGTYAGHSERRAQRWLWRRLASRAVLVGAEGLEVERECTGLLGLPPDRVFLAPNGRDPAVFHPAPRADAGRTPLVTFVGALTDGKRPGRFVDVVAGLRRRQIDVRARIVGDGPLRASLDGPAAQAGVELLGWRADVAEILRESDLMVFPSGAVGEGMPGVLIEAGLSGVPVVATDVPGVSTIVAHGETGTIVPVDDPAAMVEAVAVLLDDAALRSAMGHTARQRCTDRFSLDAVADVWLQRLGPLVAEVPAPPR